jgi:sulfate adenylyltransferase
MRTRAGLNGTAPFYDSDETQSVVKNVAESLGIVVVPFDELVYLPFEDEFCPMDEVAAGTETISLSSLDIRDRIRTGRKDSPLGHFSGSGG